MKLTVEELSKSYKDKVAVSKANLTFKPGVYGLLGVNGAGKTTLMRMLCGLLKPTSGRILFDNQEISKMGEAYHAKLGYMPQDFGIYPDFTAREFMLYLAAVKGLEKKKAQSQTEKLLDMVNLTEMADKKIKTYSGGMKQRLGIAQAELNEPSILILDEPTAGLDPKERVRFRNLISNFAKEKIVILSTHIVSDVDYIADVILLMKEGSILLQNSKTLIVDEIKGKVWEVLVTQEEADRITQAFCVVNLHHENTKIHLRVVCDTSPTTEAYSVEPTLEDLFLYYFQDQVSNVE